MGTYIPKDDRLFTWDPENMEKYWEQCQKFDRYPEFGCIESEQKSQLEFHHSLSENSKN